MKNIIQKTLINQIENDLANLQDLIKKDRPKSGWIKLIRKALGMSSYDLAKRIKCSQSEIIAYEKREESGNITLNSLEKLANGLECKCVYFFVPKEGSLENIIKKQAKLVAQKKVAFVSHSMDLEQQKPDKKQIQQQEDALVDELLHGTLKDIWKD